MILSTLAASEVAQQMALSVLLIVVLGVGAQWLAWKIRFPSILLLLGFGFVVGPGAAIVAGHRLLDPDRVFGDLLLPLVGVSVGLILYGGGLTLRTREIEGVGRVVAMLVSIGAAITWIVAALGAKFILGISAELATLVGAILIVTGPTVVGPLLQHIRPAGQVGPVLRWEGIVIDPIGAVAAVLVLETLLAGSANEAPATIALAILTTIVVGGGIGVACALFLLGFLDKFWIPEHLQNPVSLMLVVAAYTVSNILQQESGLLATTVMGIVLANQRRVDVRHILEFKENLGVLIIAALFIVLAARITPEQLDAIHWPRAAGFLALLIFVARPLSALVSTIGAGLSWKERLFISWMAPRGIVAAAVSSVFALSLGNGTTGDAGQLVPIIFAMIVGTDLVYGLTSPPLARILGISDQDPQGIFIVGASPFARSIATKLNRYGVTIGMIDTNRGNVTAARMAGLNVAYGNILEELIMDDLDLRGIGRVLAMTPNEEVNTLALQRFTHIFGKANLYRLAARPEKVKDKSKDADRQGPGSPGKMPRGSAGKPKTGTFKANPITAPVIPGQKRSASVDSDPAKSTSTGRRLFDRAVDLSTLEKRLAAGWVIKATSISDEFTFADYQTLYGDEAVPMFAINPDGGVQITVAGKSMEVETGSRLISLVNPETLFMHKLSRASEDSAT